MRFSSKYVHVLAVFPLYGMVLLTSPSLEFYLTNKTRHTSPLYIYILHYLASLKDNEYYVNCKASVILMSFCMLQSVSLLMQKSVNSHTVERNFHLLIT
jgi:hypothetical protein